MKAVELKTTNVANRVARFRELVPYKHSIMDGTGIPAEAVEIVSAKSVYPIMSPEGWEGRSAVAPVKGMNGLTVTIAECPPGNHPGLHSHSHTVENFFCLNGKFRVSWGEDGENSVELDPMDFVSVPAGVYRDFHNISDETARLLVMIQNVEGDTKDEVIFHPHVGQEILEKFGEETLVAMDKVGFRFADRLQAAE
jgi:uncharacterized RmlC-like cupin family protein